MLSRDGTSVIIHRVRQWCHVLATKPGTDNLPGLYIYVIIHRVDSVVTC